LTASSFLAYTNKLYVARIITSAAYNATSSGTQSGNTVVIKNEDHWVANGAALTVDANTNFVAKYPGSLGNSLKVSVCDHARGFESTAAQNITLLQQGANSMTVAGDVTAGSNSTVTKVQAGDVCRVGNSTTGVQDLTVSAINSTVVSFATKFTGSANVATQAFTRRWGLAGVVDGKAPGTSAYVSDRSGANDQLHIVVTDEDGDITGTPNTVLEVFAGLSRATDAKDESGNSIYFKDVIDNQSAWLWTGVGSAGASLREGAAYVNTAANMAASGNSAPLYDSLAQGADSAAETATTLANLSVGYDLFADASKVDVSMILQGKAAGTSGANYKELANYIVDNITSTRKDCIAFLSPHKSDVVNNAGSERADSITFGDSLTASSYSVLDSGYKYMYDKYNDVYVWVPLNGDVAGLCARTDTDRDPWFSPAGYSRGQIKNVVKLAFNPPKADRDVLYQADINPVVTFPGKGTVLFGDKTKLGQPSAFDRINVRRLFIVLEKAIATAAEFALFEFNDEFTRSQFKNLVEPFLREVQGRRGIYDFEVVCDETNNTGEVIDNNSFVGDIYVKPARSINFIQLNFVAVRTGVEFSEIVGKF
jgi:phage tail sheath protein FI